MQLSDLKQLSGQQVKEHNQELAFLARRVYKIAGNSTLLRRKAANVNALAVKMSCGEQTFTVGFSKALLDLFLASFGANSQELSGAWLDFMVRAELPKFLPATIVVHGVVEHDHFEHVLAAQIYGSDTDSGLAIGIDGAVNLIDLLMLFDKAVIGVTPAPFANVPITLPLMASTFEVPAGELADLQVGDVLFI